MLDITGCVVSDEIRDFLTVSDCPTSLSPGAEDSITLLFAPTAMYQHYVGSVTIQTADIYYPLIEIPFDSYTGYHKYWNWVSFPFAGLERDEVLSEINPFGAKIAHENGNWEYDGSSWNMGSEDQFRYTKCYKINMSGSSDTYDISFEGGHQFPTITLYPNQDNWVGYWLAESQNIDDAFGNDFEDVISVKSEKWYYYPTSLTNPNGRGEETIPICSKVKPLHFGRGYIVRVDEQIDNFSWNTSSNPPHVIEIADPENFEFEPKSDYEAIDILGLSQDVVEVGAFIDTVCIGAAAVTEDSKAQILAYTDDIAYRGSGIHFEVVTTQRCRNKIPEYYVYNEKSGSFNEETIWAQNQSQSLVCFNKDLLNQDDVPGYVTLAANYPNPFNPETTITYSLPHESDVCLEVFNVKGQKVRTLVHEKLGKGYHSVVWNGENESRKPVSSGVYFYRLSAAGKNLVHKMLLLK